MTTSVGATDDRPETPEERVIGRLRELALARLVSGYLDDLASRDPAELWRLRNQAWADVREGLEARRGDALAATENARELADDAAHQTDGDDRHVDVNELVALLRAFYAEEYQRDQHGEPSGVWTLLTQLTRGLGVVILDVNDPARWLAPDSDWRSIVDAEKREAAGDDDPVGEERRG